MESRPQGSQIEDPQSKKAFNRFSSYINLEKYLENKSSFLNFFNSLSSNKKVITMTLYKSSIILGISDSLIIAYDIINEKIIVEYSDIKEKNVKLIQMELLFENKGYIDNDYLVCLCENSFSLLDTYKYQIKFNYDLKFTPVKFIIDYHEVDNRIRICIFGKSNILICEFLEKSYFVKLIEFDDLESHIVDTNLLFLNNIIIYESKLKIVFLKIDYAKRNLSLQANFMKKDLQIYKEISSLKDYGKSLGELNLSLYTILFAYSELKNSIFMILSNKIYILKNNFDNFFAETFEISQKISKPMNILSFIVEDPFAFVIFETKIQIYFINDLEKPLESIDVDISLQNRQIYIKPVNLLYKQKKFSLETELINYSDSLHLKKVKYQGNRDFTLNSNQFLVLILNTKKGPTVFPGGSLNSKESFYFEWIYSSTFDLLIDQIKSMNIELSCIYLKYLKSLIPQISNKEDKNKLIILRKCVEQFMFLIDKGKFDISKTFHVENNLDFIFIIYLMKNYIFSSNLHKIINILISKMDLNHEDFENYLINSDDNIMIFLKNFMNKLINYGNEYHKSIEKEKKRALRFDLNSNSSTELISQTYSEEELKYILLENAILISHFISFKFSRKTKYTDQMKVMIKNSYKILEKEIIDDFIKFNLEEEVLLYYFYRGNYCLCINTIINIYNNLENKSPESIENNNYGDFTKENDLDKEIFIKLNNSIQNTLNDSQLGENPQKIDQLKMKWFIRFLNLILIVSDKISNFEYLEYIKWGLLKNPFKTIDMLFEYKKLSTEKLDMEIIELLKTFGIDSVLYYFFSFIQKNTTKDADHYNEIVNLYTIKLKLLFEKFENVSMSGTNLEIKKIYSIIQKTRNEFLNFLIDDENFNLKFAIEKVKVVNNLDIETGVLLIKNNQTEEGISKFFDTSFEESFKILKKINIKYQNFEILSESIKLLLSEKGEKFTTDKLDKIGLCLELMEIFKNNHEIIIEILSLDYFDNYKIDKFLDFMVRMFTSVDVSSKSYKIENSLTDEQLTHYFNRKLNFEKKFFLIDRYSTCNFCKKGFFNSELVYIYSKTTYHYECYHNKILNNQEKN